MAVSTETDISAATVKVPAFKHRSLQTYSPVTYTTGLSGLQDARTHLTLHLDHIHQAPTSTLQPVSGADPTQNIQASSLKVSQDLNFPLRRQHLKSTDDSLVFPGVPVSRPGPPPLTVSSPQRLPLTKLRLWNPRPISWSYNLGFMRNRNERVQVFHC